MGHIRSLLLGNALTNLIRYCGGKVCTLNYLGDSGRNLSLILAQTQVENKLEIDLSNFDDDYMAIKTFGRIYARAVENSSKNENFNLIAKKVQEKIEKSLDSDEFLDFQKLKITSLNYIEKFLSDFGINFDLTEFESEFTQKSLGIASFMENKNHCQISNDKTLRYSTDYAKNCVLRKSDNSPLYLTR